MRSSRLRPKKPDTGVTAGPDEVRPVALGLLARREHGAAELARKLTARGFAAEVVGDVVGQLVDDGLLSERRYIEEYVRVRAGKGYGPVRIRAELRERGIEEALIDPVLDDRSPDWHARMKEQRRKRFGEALPDEYDERARQMRFLQQRGFAAEQIRRLFKESEM